MFDGRPMVTKANLMAKRHVTWLPRARSLLLTFPLLAAVTMWFAKVETGTMAWYVSIVWSWPALANLVGVYGIARTRWQIRRNRLYQDDAKNISCLDMLIVVVPTIGRHDTYPALERSVLSFVASLPSCFPKARIDVVIEEACEARERIFELCRRSPFIRIVVVPKEYRTPNGTRFKARANHYSHELRIADGEAREDVWVLHMDDDTGLAVDSARAMAQFIERQRLAGDQANAPGPGHPRPSRGRTRSTG